jgi:uncharacterized protein (TIGR02300 family)
LPFPFARSDLWRRRVAKPDWGTKRVCLNCGARFYDLNRESIVCPSCGTPYDATAHARPRRTRSARLAPVVAEEAERAPPVQVEEEEEVTVETEDEAAASEEESEEEDEEETDSAIEDVSELADDDMADVIDTEIDEDEGER